jgi:hypothetical protein
MCSMLKDFCMNLVARMWLQYSIALSSQSLKESCQWCAWGITVENKLQALFDCPPHHHIRLKYERYTSLLT